MQRKTGGNEEEIPDKCTQEGCQQHRIEAVTHGEQRYNEQEDKSDGSVTHIIPERENDTRRCHYGEGTDEEMCCF